MRRILLAFMLVASISLWGNEEQPIDLPLEDQIKMILTAMKYNDSFRPAAIDTISIGILHGSNVVSTRYSNDFIALFRDKFGKKTFFQRPIEVRAYTALDQLRNHPCHILFIAPDLDIPLSQVLVYTAEKAIVSVSGVAGLMTSGVSLVVGILDEKRFVAINMATATREKSQFNPRLLQLAILIRDGN